MNGSSNKIRIKKEKPTPSPLVEPSRKPARRFAPETPGPGDGFGGVPGNTAHARGARELELETENEELRRSKAEAEASLVKYADLYEFSPVGYFTFDNHGLIKELNVTGAQMLGMEKRMLLNHPVLSYIAPSHRATFNDHLSEVFRTHSSAVCEIEFLKSGGTTFHAQLHSLCFKMGDEDPGVCRTSVSDVTARKRAENALKEGEKRYRSLFENMLDGYAYCKMLYDDLGRPVDFVYLDVNSAFQRLTGLKHVTGKRVTEAIPGIKESNQALLEIYSRVALTGKPEKFEIEFQPLALWLSISVYSTERGYFTAVFDDITERKRAEEEIWRLNEDLKKSLQETEAVNKELEAFSSSVSHDLRAPLRSIEGFTNAIIDESTATLSGTSKDYLQRVISASRRMSQLIDAMLNMARLTQRELKGKNVSLSDLAEVIVRELQKKDPGRRVAFSIAKGVKVKGDVDMLRSVLENLLDNAWKFTGRHQSAAIEFGVIEKDGKAVYCVRDNGAGFDMAYADTLFRPFKRLHGQDEFPGIGIGLATVKRIIHRHGGQIWAEGAPGQGATFYFTLG